MNEPIMKFNKTAENNTNKIRIPKPIIDQWGREFYMYVYQDKIVLIPIKKEK
jgi:hypothetical protein